MESILTSTKKLLGLDENYSQFDPEIIMDINSVFMILNQLGVGPAEPFIITSDAETWSEFSNNITQIQLVKTYMYLKVRLMFDPPTSSLTQTSIENQIKEYEWRLNVQVCPGKESNNVQSNN